MKQNNMIPVTVLTGFLGAGKSTLLNRVLNEAHGRRIAVVENEYGEENIDGDVMVSGGCEQIVAMSNGCVCCSIRDDLRVALLDLHERRTNKSIYFDHVIIETTGIANPGPIIQTFLLDSSLVSKYKLDGVLTVVDAVHAAKQLDTRHEARRQVGFADRIFISKIDIVDKIAVDLLSDRVRHINPAAPQSRVHLGNVRIDEVFNVGGFHEEGLGMNQGGGHQHDDVHSFVFRSDRPLRMDRFRRIMITLAESYGSRLLRYKGIVNVEGNEVVVQGVHQLMDWNLLGRWHDGNTRLVFIGIGLPSKMILENLTRCTSQMPVLASDDIHRVPVTENQNICQAF